MDKLVIDFLNTKFPDSVSLGLNLIKTGMPALICEIHYVDGSMIGRYIYYFETKHSYLTSSKEIEECIRMYFPISSLETNRIFGDWVQDKNPSIPDFSC